MLEVTSEALHLALWGYHEFLLPLPGESGSVLSFQTQAGAGAGLKHALECPGRKITAGDLWLQLARGQMG